MNPDEGIATEDAARGAQAAHQHPGPDAARGVGGAEPRSRRIEPDLRVRGPAATFAGAARQALEVLRAGPAAAGVRRAAARRAVHDACAAAQARPVLTAAVAAVAVAALLPLARAARRSR